MIQFYRHFLLIAILIGAFACTSQKVVVEQETPLPESELDEVATETPEEEEIYIPEEDPMDDDYLEERTLRELHVTAPRGYVLKPLKSAADRIWDLQHMDLDIRFNWDQEQVIGSANLQLSPYFYDQNDVALDAKGFIIHQITDEEGRSYTYNYDGQKLTIELPRTYHKAELLNITIDYTANPSEGPMGGSMAITSDKGLFFINPRGEEGDKPRQIWTQGETENNSRWFPTIDKPNENLTHNISMTVRDEFVTLSNGTLTSSVNNEDGTRTDTWQMTKPHAPYLVMVAVGEFAVVREEVDGLLYEYYVEPEYEPYAKQIFAHTPEMMQFFAELIDYPYPWDKYSQIITRDYVSGAMENTTAVIFGDFIQKTDRELIDDGNDYIIAHELFHHWFGDLVTCESWANLTLNEGFANYSEYLWQEYKYGKDAAGYQRKNERQGYLASIMQTGTHPLIDYGYEDKEDMFDGHSYNKGGLTLHMLRHELGDEAFYAGLNRYLNDHRHTAVEVDELRMAFEDESGLDLLWFFEQWYHSAGHPILEITHEYDTVNQTIILTVNQTQDPESSPPIYILPTTVSVYNESGEETQFDITIDKREYTIDLNYPEPPAVVVFDKKDALLMVKREDKTTREYMNQYRFEETFIHRFEAINKIRSKREAAEFLVTALDDGHYSIRKLAVDNMRLSGKPDLANRLVEMAKNDEHSAVRGAALKKLKSADDLDMTELLQEVLEQERSYNVIGDALETLARIDEAAAMREAVKLKEETSTQLVSAVSKILATSGDKSHLPYFEQYLTSISLFSVFNFYESYYDLVSSLDTATIMNQAEKLKEIASDPTENIFYKFTATNVLFNLKNDLAIEHPEESKKLDEMIMEIKSKETNELLRQRYGAF